jgi:nucleotide-binding universal stress UspA family protein
MSFKDIIVYVDGTEASKARVAFAIALAKAQDADLIGVAFAPKALLPLSGADVGFADMSEVLASVKAQGEAALKGFKASAKEAGVAAEGRLMQIGQYALVERCLFASGRPVMIVPAAPAEIVPGGTVLAAWDGSAEAARAFNDALIFLKAAKRVVLLIGVLDDTGEEHDPPTDDMMAHLKRHGVSVEVARVRAREGDIGRLLLAEAKDRGAEMTVMGAWQHSRWREFILGGVTLTMLEEATIPLLMAH